MIDTRRMDGNNWRAYLVAAIIGLASGSGGAFTLGQSGAFRPNPFTSLDARDLRLELERKIMQEERARERLEERVRALENWMSQQKKATLKR